MKMKLRTNLGIGVIGLVLVAGVPGAVAEENTSVPARDAGARITSLVGMLVDDQGESLKVGSPIAPGCSVRSADGKDVRVVLTQAGLSSSVIRIGGGSKVEFVKLSVSDDADYPLLDTELVLRSNRVRETTKRIF